MFRINHRSWWKRELPSKEEMDEGIANLAKHNNSVDYILTHCPYTSLLAQIGNGMYQSDFLPIICKTSTKRSNTIVGALDICILTNLFTMREQFVCLKISIVFLMEKKKKKK